MTRRLQPEAEVFGRRLREIRTERGLTQAALAQASGLIDTYISDMERGLKVPSLTTVLRLAGALECKPTALIKIFDVGFDFTSLARHE
jgi:transcriptional regulator with XRE-family HTH domain